jgi:hypothetical protein
MGALAHITTAGHRVTLLRPAAAAHVYCERVWRGRLWAMAAVEGLRAVFNQRYKRDNILSPG